MRGRDSDVCSQDDAKVEALQIFAYIYTCLEMGMVSPKHGHEARLRYSLGGFACVAQFSHTDLAESRFPTKHIVLYDLVIVSGANQLHKVVLQFSCNGG